MTWHTTRARSFKHFVDISSQLAPNPDHLFWFRGQSASDWDLEPSLMRALGDASLSTEEVAALEDEALQTFRSQAHLFVSPVLLDKVHTKPCWWALMQHHGAPTRLLDWSESPYVAAYFAAQNGRKTDGAVWYFCRRSLQNAVRERLGEQPDFTQPAAVDWFDGRLRDLRDQEVVMPIAFGYPSSQRIAAQQGRFTMCFKARQKHNCLIPLISTSCAHKIIIPADKKSEFILRLREMNITGATLFPGVDGLGLSVRELISLRTK